MKEVKALSLFSGGLDSIMASRVVAAQGVKVQAIKFVSPFFNYDLLDDLEKYKQTIKKKYKIDVMVEDITVPYMKMLHNPAHGFGKNFNPCIDCKILMFKRAKELMKDLGCSFLITGEVLGQRPMSQRRDTLNVIERDSENKSILLRPLCAKLLKETEAEKNGLIDRGKLHNFSGRGRSRQIALAKEYGITDFPSPAGGCILADPILSKRVATLFSGDFVIEPKDITLSDILYLLVGRQFLLPGGGWLILGRSEKDNDKIEKMVGDQDILLNMRDRPGPTAVIRHGGTRYVSGKELDDDVAAAASLVVRYGKKVQTGPKGCQVEVVLNGEKKELFAEPLPDDVCRQWMLFLEEKK